MAFNIISYRHAGITRPDRSSSDLLKFRSEGYKQVAFVANLIADPQCATLNGNVYDIDTLLRYDNPIYRTSHPNCNCKFAPVGQGNNPEPTVEPNEPEANPAGNQTPQAGIV